MKVYYADDAPEINSLWFFNSDIRDEQGYLTDYMGSNVITSAEVFIFVHQLQFSGKHFVYSV